MSAILAIVGSVACGGSFWLLVTNTAGDCSGILGLVASVGFVAFSAVAAYGWKALLGGKIKPDKN